MVERFAPRPGDAGVVLDTQQSRRLLMLELVPRRDAVYELVKSGFAAVPARRDIVRAE